MDEYMIDWFIDWMMNNRITNIEYNSCNDVYLILLVFVIVWFCVCDMMVL